MSDARYGMAVTYGISNNASELASTYHIGTWFRYSDVNSGIPYKSYGEVAHLDLNLNMGDVTNNYTSAMAGGWWIVGNEGNYSGQDNMSASAYATWYHDTRAAILALDSTAKFVAFNSLNWARTCVNCAGSWYNTNGAGWVQAILASYYSIYGTGMPFEALGLHTYSSDWTNLPTEHSSDDIADIKACRTWMNSNGYSGIPLWITEMGIGYGNSTYPYTGSGDGLTQPNASNWLNEMMFWLSGEGNASYYIDRWYMYESGKGVGTFPEFSLKDENGNITTLGNSYAAWASIADQTPTIYFTTTQISSTRMQVDCYTIDNFHDPIRWIVIDGLTNAQVTLSNSTVVTSTPYSWNLETQPMVPGSGVSHAYFYIDKVNSGLPMRADFRGLDHVGSLSSFAGIG